MPDELNTQILGETPPATPPETPPATPPVTPPANTEFLNGFSEDLRTNEQLMRFNSNDALANSFLESQKVLSQSVRVPGENATAEERQTFLEKINMARPAEVNGYELNFGDMPEAIRPGDSVQEWYKATAHNLNVPKDTAEKLFAEWASFNAKEYDLAQAEANKIHTDAETKLKADFGTDYDANVKATKELMNAIFSPESMQELLKFQLGDSPHIIKDLHALSQKVSADTIAGTTNTQNASGLSLDEQLRSLTGDKDYWEETGRGRELRAEAMQIAEAINK